MDFSQNVRIGTRDSKLALWQANRVKEGLEKAGIPCTLVPVKSEGDLDLVTPLYEMGVEGVFTKTLDACLLSNKIDIAVHSMKDVPIQLAKGLQQAAVLRRGSYKDILIVKDEKTFGHLQSGKVPHAVIATGSVRRRAQWLHRYPEHTMENLRGNVQTRLQKIKDNDWDGAIFAAAGLERLEITTPYRMDLDWMLPAPAQGAIMVVCREQDQQIKEQCRQVLNDTDTEICVQAERDFLEVLMGGCATPISAWACIQDGALLLKGNILSPDGKDKIACDEHFALSNAGTAGKVAAVKLFARGGNRIIASFRK